MEYGKLDIISNITSIPEKDCSFDAILCTEVFEHIPDPISAIKEFYRLLKIGGKLILTAPFCSLTHFAPYHYYSGFNKYFYEYYLDRNKFRIVEIKSNGDYFQFIAQEVRRLHQFSTRYSNYKFDYDDINCICKFIKLLDNIELKNKNSEEVLCHGFHILAEKV